MTEVILRFPNTAADFEKIGRLELLVEKARKLKKEVENVSKEIKDVPEIEAEINGFKDRLDRFERMCVNLINEILRGVPLHRATIVGLEETFKLLTQQWKGLMDKHKLWIIYL
jgi:chemotaxis regulatin CheY-phosphate phosphatase CheZ